MTRMIYEQKKKKREKAGIKQREEELKQDIKTIRVIPALIINSIFKVNSADLSL